MSVFGLSLGLSATVHAEERKDDAQEVSEVVVTGSKHELIGSATGLPLSIRDTPQQVAVIRSEQIRDYALTDINQLLAQVPGVNVEQVETDRTQYDARGFDITNMQMDGVGLPLISGIQFGSFDTAMFDRVEVVSGANAIMTGIGNPSATVNYIRKRPTETFQGDVAAEVGSWNHERLEADLSGPLNASGSLRGRVVVAGQSEDSYLDHYSQTRGLFYGVAAWDATSNLTFTAGFSRDDSRSKGVLWGALPLEYSDGQIIDYPVSASTSADWTYWNILDQTTFLEATYALPFDWTLKATGTYRSFNEQAKLLYAFGYPDQATGLGVEGMSGVYPSKYRQYMFDVAASGPFDLFGRTHQLAFGFSSDRNDGKEYEAFSDDYPDYPSVYLWNRQQVAEPTYPGAVLQTDIVDKLYKAYVSSRLTLTDRLKAVVGAVAVDLDSTGYSYGVSQARTESKVSPYAGLIFDLTKAVSLYASYTDIFDPQVETDINHVRLAPAHGKSYEAGVKSDLFDKRLYVTAAVYRAQQLGLAEQMGILPDGQAYYAGLNTTVTGFEAEATGKITDVWSVNGGFTTLKMTGSTESADRTYIPRNTFKLATSYGFPALQDLKLGAAVRWQDQTSIQDLVLVTQKAYAVVDLTASAKVTDKVRATLNVKNLGDDKHYGSLAWGQAFYDAPRSVSARLDYAF